MKMFFKILSAILALMLTSIVANAAYIQDVEVLDNSKIGVRLSEEVQLEGKVNADLKVFKDLLATYSYKDDIDPNKIIINLTHNMYKGESYSLLGVIGSEANVDFVVGEDIPTEIIPQESEEIEKILILDATTLEVYYKEELDADDFVYKVLQDVPVDSQDMNEEGVMEVVVQQPLEADSSYIFLINTLKDISGEDVDFDEMFKDFKTKVELNEVLEPQQLNAAHDPSYVMDPEVEEGNVPEIALKAEQTPDTGAATWVLVLATLCMSTFFFIKRK